MNKALIFILSFAFFLLFACKTVLPEQPTNTTGDNYTVKKGDCFDITFTANASLGMAWFWKNKDAVTIVDSTNVRYHQQHPELIGSSSTLFWTFRGMERGTDTLLFEFCPVYEQQTMVKQRKVVVTVK